MSLRAGRIDVDPDACLRRLIDAIQDGDYEDAGEAAEDLRDWLTMGGFIPTLDRQVLCDLLGEVSALAFRLARYDQEDKPCTSTEATATTAAGENNAQPEGTS